LSLNERRGQVKRDGSKMSIRWQCKALGLCRGSLYYKAEGISALNVELMSKIDREYTERPYLGRPKLTELMRRMGHAINPKRIGRLMRLMDIRGIVPRLNTSKPNPQHKVYPYLLRGVQIVKKNQVWATDITFLRLKRGFMYLTAVIDVFSRYVLSWELSNTLDTGFCISAVESAIEEAQATPEIFNTDQGAQFTSYAFTEMLLRQDIRISMDGKGRALDNVFIERLWRSVKYECTYLEQFETVSELKAALKSYFEFYNSGRYHQALNYKTPKEVYFGENATNHSVFIA
jgi:putative transposase